MSEDALPEASCLLCGWRTPTDVRSHVCGPCTIREMRRLGEIVTLYALLPAALDVSPVTVIDLTYPPIGGARPTAVRRCEACVKRGHPDWVIPCTHDRPDGGDQIGDINVAAILDSWVRDWCDTIGCTDPPKVPTVARLANWLQIWLAMASREHAAIDEYARDIRNLAAKMRRAINRDLTPVRYEAPCPYCQTKTLQREAGGDWIECGGRDGCGRLWGEDEYGLLARAAIPDDELLSTVEAAQIADVKPALIRKWDQRGRLVPAQHDDFGRPWYAKIEVLKAAGGAA